MPRPKLLAAATAGLIVVAAVTRLGLGSDSGRAVAKERPASVFVAMRGADANPCSRRRPCATFARAYHRARPGEVVEVAAGRYPDQELGARRFGRSQATISFRPARGAVVTVNEINVEGASHVAFHRFRVSESVRVVNSEADSAGSQHVSFVGLRAQTFKVIGRVSDIAVRGGVYGDTVDWQPQIVKNDLDDPDSARPRNVLIDGVRFQNFTRSSDDSHTECLQVLNVDGLVIRNSRFNNCDGTGDIGITDGPSDNLLIENNFLGKAGDAFYSMQITKNVRNLVLRYNSASKAASFSDDEHGGPYTIIGNYMPFSDGLCVPEGTYSHNVFAGGRCSRRDVRARGLQFANIDGFDLHLTGRSGAINRGDPLSYPKRDIDGDRRPAGRAPDAGADERP